MDSSLIYIYIYIYIYIKSLLDCSAGNVATVMKFLDCVNERYGDIFLSPFASLIIIFVPLQ